MGPLIVVACYVTVIAVLVLLAARVRRRGISAPILDVFDQMYRPTAHESRFEILAEEECTAPNETPDIEDAQRGRDDRAAVTLDDPGADRRSETPTPSPSPSLRGTTRPGQGGADRTR